MTRHIVLLTAALALVAAACGGSSDGEGVASLETEESVVALGGEEAAGEATATTSRDPEVDAEEAMLAFAQCMRDQGIDLPDPEVDEDGNLRFGRPGGGGGEGEFDGDLREAMQVAREACAEHLEGVTQQFRDIDLTELEDQLLEYAACMRDNGYDMPDPDFGAFGQPGQGGPGGLLGGAVDPESEAFQSANEVCQDLFAGGLGRGLGRGGQG
jgi:hypothetical protein